ncbi:uncharacterized protein PHACADRAFT_189277 [Phanerochaete carnosa HHB-10118-sp]|uniref:hAT-like transposase RNase-H fold domain-containing protein n=1 Tax=Phanerochaete carnosa (strain HHB-10118-sp) TaxID=650164 RepID=K5VMV7_PHACS|nr:uncharacterized protein PHACADRAFT_189277 [Phanerochaete carnosa HHB-10118-sp]EKM48025.1 hypothetical protein PHACADRAFT_189277 [Phanerochaete carnosa HHB-10118-sp]
MIQEEDWTRVQLCADILMDANKYQQHFSSDQIPTLHRAIPALENLCARWEKKADDRRYEKFHSALRDGVDKLSKYYWKLDDSRAYILALLLHPYYKSDYIQMKWGGKKEQEEAIKAGNFDAINWQEHAEEIIEKAPL